MLLVLAWRGKTIAGRLLEFVDRTKVERGWRGTTASVSCSQVGVTFGFSPSTTRVKRLGQILPDSVVYGV